MDSDFKEDLRERGIRLELDNFVKKAGALQDCLIKEKEILQM